MPYRSNQEKDDYIASLEIRLGIHVETGARPARVDGSRVSDGRRWWDFSELRDTFDGDGQVVRPLLDEVLRLRSALTAAETERDAAQEAPALTVADYDRSRQELWKQSQSAIVDRDAAHAALGAVADVVPVDEWKVGAEPLAAAVARIVAERSRLRLESRSSADE